MVLWYLWLRFFHSSPLYKIKFVRYLKFFSFDNLTCAFKKVLFLFWATCICELPFFLKSKDILSWGVKARWGPALWLSLLINTVLKQLLVYAPFDVGACIHPHFCLEIRDVPFYGFSPSLLWYFYFSTIFPNILVLIPSSNCLLVSLRRHLSPAFHCELLMPLKSPRACSWPHHANSHSCQHTTFAPPHPQLSHSICLFKTKGRFKLARAW